MNSITEFRGEYAFLSNMYPCKIKLGNVTYSCAEAAFQAVKLEDKSQRKMFAGLNGYEARKLGRQVKLRADWAKIKVDVMRWIICEKFAQNLTLKLKLIDTNDMQLIEGNTWGDTFWGVCNGNGQNQLGKILMQYRNWQTEKCLDKLPLMIGYTRLDEAIVPYAVREAAGMLCDEALCGLDLRDYRWWKEEFYAFEQFIVDPYGDEYHHIALISNDGEALIDLDMH